MAKVSGFVYVKETGARVPGLIVTLFDYDPAQQAPVLNDFPGAKGLGPGKGSVDLYKALGDALGSALTDQNGYFELEFDTTDFKRSDPEGRPDLVVIVLAPSTSSDPDTFVSVPQAQRILHATSLPRTNAAKMEAFAIRLWQAQLETFDLLDAVQSANQTSLALAAKDKHREMLRNKDQKSRKIVATDAIKSVRTLRSKVDERLAGFVPTSLPKEVREAPTFLQSKDKLDDAQLYTVRSGLKRRAAKNRPDVINLSPPEVAKLKEIATETPDGALRVEGSAMLALTHEGGTGEAVREHTLADLCPHPRDKPHVEGDGTTPPPNGDTNGTNGDDVTTAAPLTIENAREEVLNRTVGQIQDLETWDPDEHKNKRSTIEKLKKSIEELKVAKGPADVTAIHDFHSVQVAWDHVWAEVYDEQLNQTTRRLLNSWEQFKSFTIDVDAIDAEDPWLTAEDAKRDLNNIEEELQATAAAYPAPLHLNELFLGMLTPEFWAWLGFERQISLDDVASAVETSEQLALAQQPRRTGQPGAADDIEERNQRSIARTRARQSLSNMRAQVREWRETFLQETSSKAAPPPETLALDFGSWARVRALVTELKARLKEPYAFKVFAFDSVSCSVNYGLVATYRQFWEPLNYQVGELVGTIPLAPGEKRQYTTKTTLKKSRVERMAEDSLFMTKSESTVTSRAESEILRRAALKSAFDYSTNNEYGGSEGKGDSPGLIGSTSKTSFGLDVESESRQVKKNFRESILKAAQEYRKNRKHELATTSEQTLETTTSGELSNPNNEIPVTYLLYELQRQYEVSEKLHGIQPVIFVAQEVPAPHEIDDDWLVTYEWILKRVLLDDGFAVVFDHLRSGFVSDNFTIEVLRDQWRVQRDLVKSIEDQVGRLVESQSEIRDRVTNAIRRQAEDQSIFEDIGEFFTGGADDQEVARARVEAAERAMEFIQSDLADARGKLAATNDALQQAAQKLSDALREQLNQRIAIDQLRVHIKENILYYMHAIWDHEVPDQRFMRLYCKEVPFPRNPNQGEDLGFVLLDEKNESPAKKAARGGVRSLEEVLEGVDIQPLAEVEPDNTEGGTYEIRHAGPVGVAPNLWSLIGTDELHKRRLIEIADVGNPIGYWANYIILPLREPNYLTSFMARNYVDDYFGVWDPDTAGNYTTDELIEFMECVQGHVNDDDWQDLVDELSKRLQKPRRDKDVVVVPSDQLYIESLPGSHAVIEDFKLLHRAVDVQKALSEVREQEIDNLRRAWRLIEGEREDPEVDKVVTKQTIASE